MQITPISAPLFLSYGEVVSFKGFELWYFDFKYLLILVFWMGGVVPSYHGWSHQFEV